MYVHIHYVCIRSHSSNLYKQCINTSYKRRTRSNVQKNEAYKYYLSNWIFAIKVWRKYTPNVVWRRDRPINLNLIKLVQDYSFKSGCPPNYHWATGSNRENKRTYHTNYIVSSINFAVWLKVVARFFSQSTRIENSNANHFPTLTALKRFYCFCVTIGTMQFFGLNLVVS